MPLVSSVARLVLPALLVVGLAACAAPRQGAGGQPAEPPPAPAEEPLDLAAFEDFDAAPYAVEPVERRVEIEHRVPRALMESRADAGQEVTVQGYRLQLYSTLEQAEADSLRESFRRLWRRHYRATADTLASDTLAADAPEDAPLPPLTPEPDDFDDPDEDDEEPLRGPFLTSVFDERPGLYLVYRQPYYRIRVGDFARRRDAEDALAVVRAHYPDAFIVPDEVTVVR